MGYCPDDRNVRIFSVWFGHCPDQQKMNRSFDRSHYFHSDIPIFYRTMTEDRALDSSLDNYPHYLDEYHHSTRVYHISLISPGNKLM